MMRFLCGVVLSFSVMGVCWAASSREFDNVDDKVTISDITVITGKSAASYAMWVYSETFPSDCTADVVMRKDGEFTLQLHDECSGGTQQGFLAPVWGASLGTYPSQQFCAYASFTTNTWHHVIMRWSTSAVTGDAEVYVDGALACTVNGDDTSAIANSSASLLYGNNESNSEDLDGQLAYTRVFDKRIADYEITQEQFMPGSTVSNLQVFHMLPGESPEQDWSGNNLDSTAIAGSVSSSNGPPVMLTTGMP